MWRLRSGPNSSESSPEIIVRAVIEVRYTVRSSAVNGVVSTHAEVILDLVGDLKEPEFQHFFNNQILDIKILILCDICLEERSLVPSEWYIGRFCGSMKINSNSNNSIRHIQIPRS